MQDVSNILSNAYQTGNNNDANVQQIGNYNGSGVNQDGNTSTVITLKVGGANSSLVN